jgi:hypothetical protein
VKVSVLQRTLLASAALCLLAARPIAQEVTLEPDSGAFRALLCSNAESSVTRQGYNGVGALVASGSDLDLTAPEMAWMNYEALYLQRLPRYQNPSFPRQSRFEPRCEPMSLSRVDDRTVVLEQAETSHAHVSATITYQVEEPHYLHQRIALTFHRVFTRPSDTSSSFWALFASYVNQPRDPHLYFRPRSGKQDLQGWFGVFAPEEPYRLAPLPAERPLRAADHLEAMSTASLSSVETADLVRMWFPGASSKFDHNPVQAVPLQFYYGLHSDLVALLMFKQPQFVSLSYNLDGGGEGNPAWDYILHHDDIQPGQTLVWDVCLVLKPFEGRKDILAEVRRYLETTE